jgi:hypothetical protein
MRLELVRQPFLPKALKVCQCVKFAGVFLFTALSLAEASRERVGETRQRLAIIALWCG